MHRYSARNGRIFHRDPSRSGNNDFPFRLTVSFLGFATLLIIGGIKFPFGFAFLKIFQRKTLRRVPSQGLISS